MEVESDEGATGIGEADGDGFHTKNGEFCVAMKHVVENGCKEILVGENPVDYRILRERMRKYSWLSETGIGMAAISGIDIALMDPVGRIIDKRRVIDKQGGKKCTGSPCWVPV